MSRQALRNEFQQAGRRGFLQRIQSLQKVCGRVGRLAGLKTRLTRVRPQGFLTISLSKRAMHSLTQARALPKIVQRLGGLALKPTAQPAHLGPGRSAAELIFGAERQERRQQ